MPGLLLFVLSGSDTFKGSSQSDVLYGFAGADTMYGNAGNDFLVGGTGNDTLTGGTGKDTLTGGAGADKFDFNAITESAVGTTRDLIKDFVRVQGDKIDLFGIDANTGVAGNQAFSGTLIPSAAVFSKAGQLQYKSGVLYGNTDADVAAEFSIALTGVTSMAGSDFVL
jgi:Ca2+-binding RTX toxin-like protein